ncbi:MAG: RES family NAD+ phosphorylase [Devosia sp.]|uniref:RES family NAD+ phosphorylase n=1 Tax=Devosia sp. TaxID=1871048 RepID=UPI00339A5E59
MRHTLAPQPSFRLIPSQFPPIGLFDTVSRAADLDAVMELAGWTNDRLVAERIARLPQSEWVFGRSNSSIVMAAFLHAAPDGGRFSGPDLGAWYAADRIETGLAEVAHHLRREAFARRQATATRRFRVYVARLEGTFVDLCGADEPALYDRQDYAASQAFGERQRASGEDGIAYDSLRFVGGVAVCAYRPSKVLDVVQAQHLSVTVRTDGPAIEVETLSQ